MLSSRLTLYIILVWLTSLSLPPLIILILLQLNEQSVYASWNFSFVYILALLVSVLYGLPGLLLFAWMGYRAFKKETSLKIKRLAMVKAVGLSVVLTFVVFPLIDPANIFEAFGWGRIFIVLVYLTTAIAAAWFYPLEDRPEIKNLPR